MVISYRNILKFITCSLWIMCFLELLFFFSIENILGVITFLYGWNITKIVCLKESLFKKYPLVVLSMFSLVLMYYYLPLPFTLLDGNSLTHNLEIPVTTFVYQIIYITCLNLSFCIFRYTYRPCNFLTRIFLRIGIYKSPKTNEVWALAFIGFFAFIYNLVSNTGNVEESFANGLLPQLMLFLQNFCFVPVCFFIKDLYFSDATLKSNRKKALIYFTIIIIFALATTRRSLIVQPVLMVLLISFLLFVINKKVIKIKIKLLFFIICGVLLLQPIQDIATAMIYVRITSSSTSDKMFNEIIRIYNDKDLLRKIHAELKDVQSFDSYQAGWSEQYISNEFIERYCNLKVSDMSNYYVEKIGFSNPQFLDFTYDYIVGILPSPILKILNINIDKSELRQSPGDKIYGIYSGYNYLGYYRVFSHIGTGMAIMGYLYFPFVIFLTLIVWFLLACLCTSTYSNIKLPLISVIFIYSYSILFIHSAGVFTHITFICRMFWQQIILIAIMMYIIRFIFIKKNNGCLNNYRKF